MSASRIACTGLWIIVGCIYIAGCPKPNPMVPPTIDATDGMALPDSSDLCQVACDNLARIGCVSAASRDVGPSCADTLRAREVHKSIRKADGTWVTCLEVATAVDPRQVSPEVCR
jgi:hypothetical protein